MKKWYKECPFCANEIKEGAIKCEYCHEFLEVDNNEIIHEEKKNWIKSKFWRAIIVVYFIVTLPFLLALMIVLWEDSGGWYIWMPIIYIILTDILRWGVYYIDSWNYQLGIWNWIKTWF